MNTVTHKVVLVGEQHFGRRLPPHHVGLLLSDLPFAIRQSVSMALRNRSTMRGRRPAWLDRAADVRLMFVGESPPANGEFFYRGGTRMTAYTRRAFEHAFSLPFESDREFLDFFRSSGCWLDSATTDRSYSSVPHSRPFQPRPHFPLRTGCRRCVGGDGSTCRIEAAPTRAPSRASQTWAMLIKRVYEIDPLACPECGGQMKAVAFIEPPQGDVIEKILRHCGLWCPSSPRAPPGGPGRVHDPGMDSDSAPAASDEFRELTFVDEATFWATC